MVYEKHECLKCEATVRVSFKDRACGECPKCGNKHEASMEYYEDGSINMNVLPRNRRNFLDWFNSFFIANFFFFHQKFRK